MAAAKPPDPVALPPDVERYVARHFRREDRKDALELLAAAVRADGSAPDARLYRCAAVASGGSLDRLLYEVETIAVDYRDVIVEGEYEPSGKQLVRVRNLGEPIPDDL